MAPSCAPPILHNRKRSKPIKIFSGVGHGVKKPKPKKSPTLSVEKRTPASSKTPTSTPIGVREMMKEKFDFSRTPYAIPAPVKFGSTGTPYVTPAPVRRRVALTEESSKKRKFFKTTVEIETPQPSQPKEPKVDNQDQTAFEFEDTNYIEEAELKNVFSILDDWDDEGVHFQPQLTRQKADELQLLPTETTPRSLSYLTPMATHAQASPHPIVSDKRENNSSLSLTPVRKCDTPLQKDKKYKSPTVFHTTPSRKEDENVNDESPESKLAKMFSVFTPPARNALSDVTNKNKKTKATLDKAALDKAAAPNDQMQIDAGQKVIGPVECSSCGMVYDVGDPVDEKRHTEYHAKRYDLKYKKSKSENVVGICGTDRIILMKYSDDKKRDKVSKILKVTEEEIGCGYTWGPFSMAFIYVRNDRILGCVIVEPKVKANRVLQSDGIVLLSTETHAVKCGINRIWVKREFRKKNIATELVNCLRKNFLYGDYLKIDDIAFSATTPDGHAFAVKYTGREDYLTYEDLSTNVSLGKN